MIANFVLMDYGTGAIFGCPAHDQRDLDFARKYGLPVQPVVLPPGADPARFAVGDEAYVGPGARSFNSGFLDGLDGDAEAKRRRSQRLEAIGAGEGARSLPPARLGRLAPALLGLPDPGHPLRRLRHRAGAARAAAGDACPRTSASTGPATRCEQHPTWKHVACPSCGGRPARDRHVRHLRRLSWYFARFCSPRSADGAFEPAEADYWLPVDQYIGGIEHAVLHLLYARFFTRALTRMRLSRRRGAVRRPVHPGHGLPRDLSRRRRRLGRRPEEVAHGARRRGASTPTGRPVDDRPHREDVEVEEERGRSRRASSTSYGADAARCSCCPTARPSATWNGPRRASRAPGASSTACGAWYRVLPRPAAAGRSSPSRRRRRAGAAPRDPQDGSRR